MGLTKIEQCLHVLECKNSLSAALQLLNRLPEDDPNEDPQIVDSAILCTQEALEGLVNIFHDRELIKVFLEEFFIESELEKIKTKAKERAKDEKEERREEGEGETI